MKDKNFVVISKDGTQVTIDRKGAQIVSIKKNGVEIMFQGANRSFNGLPTQHGKTAPNLFPNLGPTGASEETEMEVNGVKAKRGKLSYNGGYFYPRQHGFIQDTDFEVQSLHHEYAILTTSADQNTANEYPFDFNYKVIVEVKEDGEIEYKSYVNNIDNQPIIAGMGWHPEFRLYNNPENYKLVLHNIEAQEGYNFDDEVVIDVDSIIQKGKSEKILGLKSADATLMYCKNGESTPYFTMHTQSPILILWSRQPDPTKGEKENLFAIEPWNTMPKSLSKLTSRDKIFETGEDVIMPGETRELTTTIKVNSDFVAEIKKKQEETLYK